MYRFEILSKYLTCYVLGRILLVNGTPGDLVVSCTASVSKVSECIHKKYKKKKISQLPTAFLL